MSAPDCTDPVILNLWHPIAAIAELRPAKRYNSRLLGAEISYDSTLQVWRSGQQGDSPMAARAAYGYLWASLGTPPDSLFDIPEFAEADRRVFNAGTIGVRVSAPRAIENFLDMGHFPYVHTDILGAEPHTEVKPYEVEISQQRDEVLAKQCKFFQPRPSTAADGSIEVEYIYRVPHPHCSILYKSSAINQSRFDVIGLFIQPMSEEHIRAHMFICVLDERSSNKIIGQFQQTVFGQDKPILENQIPRKLPLAAQAETAVRADKASIAYRRWLSAKGVTYGVIPVVA